MSDFFSRLIGRARGTSEVVQPLIPPPFADVTASTIPSPINGNLPVEAAESTGRPETNLPTSEEGRPLDNKTQTIGPVLKQPAEPEEALRAADPLLGPSHVASPDTDTTVKMDPPLVPVAESAQNSSSQDEIPENQQVFIVTKPGVNSPRSMDIPASAESPDTSDPNGVMPHSFNQPVAESCKSVRAVYHGNQDRPHLVKPEPESSFPPVLPAETGMKPPAAVGRGLDGTRTDSPRPTIKVTIGRVDVRAVMQQPPPPAQTSPSETGPSLNEYLKNQTRGQS